MDSEAKGAGEQGRGGRRAPDSLDGALDALQGILERRRAAAATGATARQPPMVTEPATDVDELPVLEDVIIPGAAMSPLPPMPAARPAPSESRPLPSWDDLVKRLTSEAEVIIEECLQDAIARARKEIKARIKLHLDIVLPEILDEIRARDERR
jgi:hypothetical protein